MFQNGEEKNEELKDAPDAERVLERNDILKWPKDHATTDLTYNLFLFNYVTYASVEWEGMTGEVFLLPMPHKPSDLYLQLKEVEGTN